MQILKESFASNELLELCGARFSKGIWAWLNGQLRYLLSQTGCEITLVGDQRVFDRTAEEYRGVVMKNLTHQRMLFASCAASALFVNQHAIAQTDSVTQASRTEDIVVTARRREENLQTTPVGIDYSYRGKIAWGAFSGTSPFKASVAGASYGLLGARFTLSQIPLGSSVKGEIALYGRNLTNKQYVTQGIDFVLFGTKTFGDRRTIGVDAKLTF